MARRKFSFRKKVRSGYYGAKIRYHKSNKSAMLSPIIAGAVIGAGLKFGSPYINQYVPSVAGLSPTTITLLGGGLVAKHVLHKGGQFSNAAVIIGAALATSELLNNYVGTGVGGQSAGALIS